MKCQCWANPSIPGAARASYTVIRFFSEGCGICPDGHRPHQVRCPFHTGVMTAVHRRQASVQNKCRLEGGKQEGVPSHTASAAVPASLPRSLCITPFSVQWLFGDLGRSQGQRSSTMICFCTASGCCECLPVGAAVDRGKGAGGPGLRGGVGLRGRFSGWGRVGMPGLSHCQNPQQRSLFVFVWWA